MNKIFVLLFTFFCVSSLQLNSQSNLDSSDNFKHWDIGVKRIIEKCETVDSFSKYTKRSQRDGILFAKTINPLFDPDNLRINYGWFKKARKRIVADVNGGLKISRAKYISDNLIVEVVSESIENLIVRRKLSMTTKSNLECDHFDLPDFKFLDIIGINDISLPWEITMDGVSHDTVYLKQLNKLAENNLVVKEVLPSIAMDGESNKILVDQFKSETIDSYDFLNPPSIFVSLVKSNQVELLQILLYSPNYYYAINSMEALIFLESKELIQLSPKEQIRISDIKSANQSILKKMSYDSYIKVSNYRELRVGDNDIIRKYSK